jgi:predicted permease
MMAAGREVSKHRAAAVTQAGGRLNQESSIMVRGGLMLLFGGILIAMLAVTISASLQKNILEAGPALRAERWFQATLADAYFGFITFYVWVAYKEPTRVGRIVWFILIMLLGNIAMSVYMLRELYRWRSGEPFATLLLRREARASD